MAGAGFAAGAAGGGVTGGATVAKTGVGTAGCAEGLMASAPVEIPRGRRLSGTPAIGAMDATSWDATGCGLDVAGAGHGAGLEAGPGAGLGATGGEFGATIAGFGAGGGSGVGGTEAADRMALGGID